MQSKVVISAQEHKTSPVEPANNQAMKQQGRLLALVNSVQTDEGVIQAISGLRCSPFGEICRFMLTCIILINPGNMIKTMSNFDRAAAPVTGWITRD